MAAPIIAEFNRNKVQGDEVLIMVGDFTNTKQFLVYSPGFGTQQATIAVDVYGNRVLDDQQVAIVIPPNLPYNYMTVWAVNDSRESSEPIILNRATIKWVQKVIRPGETCRILGRNLAENFADGTDNSRVYFQNANSNQVFDAVVTRVNPYCIEYTAPALTAGQEYDIYVYNLHGGALGLSEPVRLTASASINWTSATLGLRQGGDQSDAERLERAFAANKNNYKAIALAETLYVHRPVNLQAAAKVKLLGNNKSTAKIVPGKSALDNTYAATLTGLLDANNMTEVHFENVTFDLKSRVVNQFINGITAKFGNGVKFINCDMLFYGVQPCNIENSNDTHFINCNTEGRIFYIGNANQTFMINVHGKQSHDSTSFAQIWGGDGFYAYGCTTQDVNPNADMNIPDTFGMGRMFSGNGVFGGQYNWHVENCNGILLTPRRGTNSDPNSGEIYMWEGNQCRASGFATSITNNGKSFVLANTKNINTVGRSWAYIAKGKGLGQYKKIANVTNGVITVDSDWKIAPDATSVIMIGHFSNNLVFYNSDGSGKPLATDTTYVNASALIKPFGGAIDTVFDGGPTRARGVGTRTTIEPFVTKHNATSEGGYPGFEGNYWSYFSRIDCVDNIWGVKVQMEYNNDGEKAGASCLLGTTFRDISSQNPKSGRDVTFESSADLPNGNRLMVFDNCEFTYDEDLKEARGSANGLVFHKKRKFTGIT